MNEHPFTNLNKAIQNAAQQVSKREYTAIHLLCAMVSSPEAKTATLSEVMDLTISATDQFLKKLGESQL